MEKNEEKRFYTYPDSFNKNYPFILAPFYACKRIRNRNFIHAIVDSGVEIFAHGAKDYPKNFHRYYQYTAIIYTMIYKDRIWFVIPDYPDDYRNNPIENNVEKTLQNIELYHKIQNVNWLYPIQADYLNIKSFHECCHAVKEYNPQRVAIGTVCKTNNIEFIERCCRMAREHFKNEWIHAFGPTLRALPKILDYIDSWDSTAYFCSRERGKGKCRNKKEREEYFYAYLKRVNEILQQYYTQKRMVI